MLGHPPEDGTKTVKKRYMYKDLELLFLAGDVILNQAFKHC